ncbi:MAG: hypothetical protein MZV49_00185 [Rhodopseudomonas palustris]|nr:hypothetical protein [Rhodopseudomonas palustris]
MYGTALTSAAETIAQSLKTVQHEMSDLVRHFAGTWVTMTKSTQTMVALYPNGMIFESMRSRLFGGQTGSWGIARDDHSQGRWTVRGTRQQGVLVMIDKNGGQTSVQYRVHVEGPDVLAGITTSTTSCMASNGARFFRGGAHEIGQCAGARHLSAGLVCDHRGAFLIGFAMFMAIPEPYVVSATYLSSNRATFNLDALKANPAFANVERVTVPGHADHINSDAKPETTYCGSCWRAGARVRPPQPGRRTRMPEPCGRAGPSSAKIRERRGHQPSP